MRRSIVTVVILLIGGFVLSGVGVLAQDDVAQANKAALLNALDEANSGNRQVLYDLFADPFMMNEGDDQLHENTPATVSAFLEMLVVGIPDLQINADLTVAQDNWVVSQLTFSGTFTNTTNFFGTQLEPTNETVSWTEMDFWQFEEGKIVVNWGQSDPMVMLGQLGVMPPMGEDEGPSSTPIDGPAGYQTLSADELAATFTSGMEESNLATWQEQLGLGLADTSAYYTDPYISWDGGTAFSVSAEQQQGDAAFLATIGEALPDYEIATPVLIAEGDYVAALIKLTGTFTQDVDMMGTTLTHTDQPVYWQIGIIDRFNADGKMVEEWAETDISSLLVGLGIMPPMDG